VALLRASSTAIGHDLDVADALQHGAGVAGGPLLLAFTTAAHLDGADLPVHRTAVEAAFGDSGLIEACLTIGAFNGLTRVADATGIALDGGSLAATTDLRAELALNDMVGALNTGPMVHDAGAPVLPSAVAELFAD
jgi:hypothetical protein